MRVLTGHVSHIATATFSPDGEIVATGGGEDGTVRLWRTRFANVIRVIDAHGFPRDTVRDHPREVAALCFSHCGQFMLSGGTDGLIRRWRVADGTLVRAYGGGWSGHKRHISAVVLSPDGKWFASASADNSILFWTVETGKVFARHESCHDKHVAGAALSPNGTILATVGVDEHVRLWEHRPHKLQSLDGALRPLEAVEGLKYQCVAFSPDGRLLAAGGFASRDQPSVAIWRVRDGKLLTRPPSRFFAALAFSPCGRYLGVAEEGAIDEGKKPSFLWEIETRRVVAKFAASNVVAFSPDSKLVAFCEGAMDADGGDRLGIHSVKASIRKHAADLPAATISSRRGSGIMTMHVPIDRTAPHEAGHATIFLACGIPVESVECRPEPFASAPGRYGWTEALENDWVASSPLSDEYKVLRRILGKAGGIAGEVLAGVSSHQESLKTAQDDLAQIGGGLLEIGLLKDTGKTPPRLLEIVLVEAGRVLESQQEFFEQIREQLLTNGWVESPTMAPCWTDEDDRRFSAALKAASRETKD